jgi:archaemetzincin
VIALACVGQAPQSALTDLEPALREAFKCELVRAPAVRLPSTAYDRRRGQYRSTPLLDALAAVKRPDWERLLGVVDVDLYVPELSFVFGEADRRRGVAVFSLARLGGGRDAGGQPLFARRAATEAIHELGHTYGLAHCKDPECVMWFSNTLAESDRKGTRFCPAHARELAGKRRTTP